MDVPPSAWGTGERTLLEHIALPNSPFGFCPTGDLRAMGGTQDGAFEKSSPSFSVTGFEVMTQLNETKTLVQELRVEVARLIYLKHQTKA